MANYDFRSLNSIDFEHLIRDVLNAQLSDQGSPVYFLSFAPGKDKGIDLLDSLSNAGNYNWIVQVKHQPNTTYSTFLSQLVTSNKARKSELEKIRNLAPKRYILATSQSLTLQNREQIFEKMHPYITSPEDILDKERINQLLTLYPTVQNEHPKLWFSNRSVFERILHNDVLGRSNQVAEDINKKLKLYVPTPALGEGEEILIKNQFLVLTGEPGCGKTTLAEILLLKLAGLDYSIYWIDKSVTEVEKILFDDESKQIFYFDDFLGHTKYEIESLKSQEKGLLHFLRRLKRLKNKYFILTTRTSLINNAALESERFRNSDIFSEKHEIKVNELYLGQKINIIKNHISVNEVPFRYLSSMNQSNFETIADHKNFSPRLIEFVTSPQHYKQVDPAYYYQYILGQLNNPNEVWLHAYEQQLDDYDRFLLTTLFSFGEAVEAKFLEEAFENRLTYEIENNHISRTLNTFYHSFKKLMDSFITLKQFYKTEKIDFINPSLEDFMVHYLKGNNSEKVRIANSFLFVQQITKRFRHAGTDYQILSPDAKFLTRLLSSKSKTIVHLKGVASQSHINLYTALIIWMFYKDENGVKYCLDFLKKVVWPKLEKVDFFHLFGFMKVAYTESMFKSLLSLHLDIIVLKLIAWSPEITFLEIIKDLFKVYDQNYEDFISKLEYYEFVKSFIDDYFSSNITDEIDDLKDNAVDISGVGEVREELHDLIESQYEVMEIYEEPDLSEFDDQKWESICNSNSFIQQMRDYDE